LKIIHNGDAALSEAGTAQSSARRRSLFIIILIAYGSSNSGELWESHKESLIEDILSQARRKNPGMNLDYTLNVFNQMLIILENKTHWRWLVRIQNN
jgi:hypothetical protein